jgi:hypothetical protein
VVEKENPLIVEQEKKDETVAVIKDVSTNTTIEPDTALDVLQQKTEELGIERAEASIPLDSWDDNKTPVSIDQLPKTGMPAFFLLGLAVIL